MSVKAILFDRDGVLIDSETYYCRKNQRFMKQFGVDLTEEQSNAAIGMTSQKTAECFYQYVKGVDYQEFENQFVKNFDTDDALPYPELLFPDVLDTLKAVKAKGIKTAVCSSACLNGIQDMLDQCHLEEYFDLIISGVDLKESKPNPEIYLLAAEKLGVTPDECIVIEDSEMGIQAGKNAHMRVIAIQDHRFGLNQENADDFVDHLSVIIEKI